MSLGRVIHTSKRKRESKCGKYYIWRGEERYFDLGLPAHAHYHHHGNHYRDHQNYWSFLTKPL